MVSYTSNQDVSKHPTLLINKNKIPWEKSLNVLLRYLDGVKVFFEKSEQLVRPKRRINGIRIDDRTIRVVSFIASFLGEIRADLFFIIGGGSIATRMEC